MSKRKPIIGAAVLASASAAAGGGSGYIAGVQAGQAIPPKLYAAPRPPGATDELDNAPYSLQPTSPAVDMGHVDPGRPLGDWDIRGEPYARIVDGDGDGVAEVDLGAYEVQAWQVVTDSCPADLDGDGRVGFSDLTFILNAWGDCPAPASAGGED